MVGLDDHSGPFQPKSFYDVLCWCQLKRIVWNLEFTMQSVPKHTGLGVLVIFPRCLSLRSELDQQTDVFENK